MKQTLNLSGGSGLACGQEEHELKTGVKVVEDNTIGNAYCIDRIWVEKSIDHLKSEFMEIPGGDSERDMHDLRFYEVSHKIDPGPGCINAEVRFKSGCVGNEEWGAFSGADETCDSCVENLLTGKCKSETGRALANMLIPGLYKKTGKGER